MPASTPPRPSQVTIAAWLVMSGSVIVVLMAFEQVAGLRSVETREAVEEFVATPMGERLGLGVQGMLSLMRILTMVTAACATAAAILGFQVLQQRSRSARLVLTVLALPLFLAGMVVGGLLPSIIVGSIAMLWFQPARDWIDGKTPRVTPATAPTAPLEADRSGPAAPPAPPTAAPTGPRAFPGFGDPTEPPPAMPPAYAAGPVLPSRPPRPVALTWACCLAWAGCAIALMVMLASVAIVLAAPDTLIDELYRQNPELRDDGITVTTLRSTVLVAGLVLIPWSAAAAVVAGFAWTGRTWAWTTLLASACCATALCLLSAIGSPVMLVPLAFCGVTIPMLLRPEVRTFVRGVTDARAPR